MDMEIMHKDQLPQGGFAGLLEKQLVVDERLWDGPARSWNGLGNFVYLADADFNPKGQTNMHPHREVDVISVMIDGRIAHEGSLEHGQSLVANQAQVQRAGGEGFSHNEINPDETRNRMIQLWVLPETPGEPAGYKLYDIAEPGVTRIYGGDGTDGQTFASKTVLEVARLEKDGTLERKGPYIAYLTRNHGLANGTAVADGHIIRGVDLEFQALAEDTMLVLVSLTE